MPKTLALIPAYLMISCASLKIGKYGDLNTPYRKADLVNVHLADSCFSDRINSDSVSNLEYMNLLDSIKTGDERYEVYFRYFLCTGPEGEVDYCQDAAIINRLDGKINQKKSAYYRSHNEIPHLIIRPIIQVESSPGNAKITGFTRNGDATSFDISVLVQPTNNLDSIRSEKRRVSELAKK